MASSARNTTSAADSGPSGNFDINKAGFVIVGIFVLTWAIALSVWHFGHIEERWDIAAAKANASD